MAVDWLSALWPALLLVAWHLYSALSVSLTFIQLQKYSSIIKRNPAPAPNSCTCCVPENMPCSAYSSMIKVASGQFFILASSIGASATHVIDFLDTFSMFMIFISILSEDDSQIVCIYFGSKGSKEHNVTLTLHKSLPCLTELWKKFACICCLDFRGQQKLHMIYRTKSVSRFMGFFTPWKVLKFLFIWTTYQMSLGLTGFRVGKHSHRGWASFHSCDTGKSIADVKSVWEIKRH